MHAGHRNLPMGRALDGHARQRPPCGPERKSEHWRSFQPGPARVARAWISGGVEVALRGRDRGEKEASK